ncbi:RNA 2',3'-cyclic phosphodiesterase [Candidatus Woesearchaeota archaeon CG10_big_fil_rev_8_21_14_0_10_34_12]|nr:MAG: RNA 2',3'-cyclic phosphodiesterase [Candidatus Woesearchaeota archaeon CG10_big_fil_rev_8_21_14_0_10_34_12]
MRVFIAIEIPNEVREEIVNFQKELEKKKLFFGKFTEKENLHLTLKFLGEVDETGVEEIKKKLKEIQFPRFKVCLGNGGVFSEDFVRIIWVQILGNGIFELQKEIDESLRDLFEREKRFMSHLTIARVKSIKDKKLLLDELGKIKFDFEFGVKKFFLKKSTLTEKGPTYENLAEIDLD